MLKRDRRALKGLQWLDGTVQWFSAHNQRILGL